MGRQIRWLCEWVVCLCQLFIFITWKAPQSSGRWVSIRHCTLLSNERVKLSLDDGTSSRSKSKMRGPLPSVNLPWRTTLRNFIKSPLTLSHFRLHFTHIHTIRLNSDKSIQILLFLIFLQSIFPPKPFYIESSIALLGNFSDPYHLPSPFLSYFSYLSIYRHNSYKLYILKFSKRFSSFLDFIYGQRMGSRPWEFRSSWVFDKEPASFRVWFKSSEQGFDYVSCEFQR